MGTHFDEVADKKAKEEEEKKRKEEEMMKKEKKIRKMKQLEDFQIELN